MNVNTMVSNNEKKVLAIFGAGGRTGRQLLKLALNNSNDPSFAEIRILVRNRNKIEATLKELHCSSDDINSKLKIIEGSIEDEAKVQATITGADYIVSMLAAPASGNSSEYPKDFMLNFVKCLVKCIRQRPDVTTKRVVVVYQAGSMSCDGAGFLHPMSFLSKNTVGRKLGILPKIADNDAAIQYLAAEARREGEDEYYSFIVTRAGNLFDDNKKEDDEQQQSQESKRTSDKPVYASHSWPPFPWTYISYQELALITLDTMKDESMYDSCPFIRR